MRPQVAEAGFIGNVLVSVPSSHIPFREIADGGIFPHGAEGGLLVMLRAYFDDSGTHQNSDVILIGGLIGTREQWDKFEAAWAAKLAEPLPSKPRLRRFHLSECNACDGDFAAYSRAESDAVIHDFRQIIIDAKLIGTALAIDRRAWNEFIVGDSLLRNFGDPVAACVERCLVECLAIAGAHPEGDFVSVWFDRSIKSPLVQEIADRFMRPLLRPRISTVLFGSVADLLPLQGADIVATESYWQAIEWLKLGDAALPRAHMRHYIANAPYEASILDRDAISRLPGLPDEGEPC
ncbi:MAG: hypothetical protein ACREJM_09145 [Candidatus Saccharimonadales bacterium]